MAPYSHLVHHRQYTKVIDYVIKVHRELIAKNFQSSSAFFFSVVMFSHTKHLSFW